MSIKRSANDLEPSASRMSREQPKRAKLSPFADNDKDSSDPSSCSVSEDSALQSSPQPSSRDRVSSMSSLEITDTDGDSESSISSDSDSDVSESDGEENIPTIGGPKKPDIRRTGVENGTDDLKARIAAFLPQMEKANGLLTSERGMRGMEDVEDGEQYIEMNLGLGVLEEQKDGSDGEDSDSSEDSGQDEREDNEDEPLVPFAVAQKSRSHKEDRVMDRLRGQHSEEQHAGIEEIG